MEPARGRRSRSGTLALTTTSMSRHRPATVLDLTSTRDAGRVWPAAGHSVGAAADAIEALLADLPDGDIGVIGPTAELAAQWLQRNGRIAWVFRSTRRKATRHASAAGSRRPPSGMLAIDWIEHEQNPREALRQLHEALGPGGHLVVVIPNLTHASARLAMLAGRHALSSSTASAHLLTLAGFERLLGEAGFTVTAVERQLDSIEALKEMAGDVPDAVIDMLAGDVDALTSHFAVAATTERSSAALLHRRVRVLADDTRAAAWHVERLDDRVAAIELRVRQWAAETDAPTAPGVATLEALTTLESRVQQLGSVQGEASDEARRAVDAAGRLAEQLSVGTNRAAADLVRRDRTLRQLGERLEARRAEIETVIRRIEQSRYRRLIHRIHDVVTRAVARGSTVAVVTRGDDGLVAFEGRTGWHFPQTDTGVYAGHHPANSDAAIAQIEQLRGRGARYLVVPRTSFWWFDHYRAFHDHLMRRYACVVRDEHTCALFDLKGRGRRR